MTAILAEGLGKRYTIGEREAYVTLRDVLSRNPFGALRRNRKREHLWALQNASFEIQRGEAIGIVGRNGSGKSTLLKILSRITEPTTGHARMAGRVGALLEVGSGFHPELTGRDNLYMSAAILGMSKSDARSRFDSIVAFAELDRFIETPVKHYSSGMYMRLAFSVAAHLEPHILLVDEVLAVGDADFQQKSVGRMGALASDGRTILFVSHNMAVIKAMTSRSIWLDGGQVRAIGPSAEIVDAYLQTVSQASTAASIGPAMLGEHRVKDSHYLGDITLEGVTLTSPTGEPSSAFPEGGDVAVTFTVNCRRALEGLYIRMPVTTPEGVLAVELHPAVPTGELAPGCHQITVTFNLGPLSHGRYEVEVLLETKFVQDRVRPAFAFDVRPNGHDGDLRAMLVGRRSDRGIVRLNSRVSAIR